MKKFLAGMLLLGASAAYAAETINVGVKGMVCSFCAHGLTKKFGAEPAVEKVDVSLEKRNIRLDLKEGRDLTDDKIKEIVKDAGYNITRIERNTDR